MARSFILCSASLEIAPTTMHHVPINLEARENAQSNRVHSAALAPQCPMSNVRRRLGTPCMFMNHDFCVRPRPRAWHNCPQ